MAVYIGVVLLGAVLFLVQYNLYCSVATHLQGIRFAGFVGDTGQSTEQGRSCEGVEAWVCPVSLITWKICMSSTNAQYIAHMQYLWMALSVIQPEFISLC